MEEIKYKIEPATSGASLDHEIAYWVTDEKRKSFPIYSDEVKDGKAKITINGLEREIILSSN